MVIQNQIEPPKVFVPSCRRGAVKDRRFRSDVRSIFPKCVAVACNNKDSGNTNNKDKRIAYKF